MLLLIALAAKLASSAAAAPSGPCERINLLCRDAGFKMGASGQGIGTMSHCFIPLVEGRPQPSDAGLPLPQVSPQLVAACAWRPCEQIRVACENAGFKPGQGGQGRGVDFDCLDPIVQGKPQPSNARVKLPRVAQPLVEACREARAGKAPAPSAARSEDRTKVFLLGEPGPGIGTGPIRPTAPKVVWTPAQRLRMGFQILPDGNMGAVPNPRTGYTFFADGKGVTTGQCPGGAGAGGAFRFTLFDNLGCRPVLRPGGGSPGAANGLPFDKDYAGGGPVLPIDDRTLVMFYHAETQPGGTCGGVPCFYGGLGMAVSTDGGQSFRSAGQIVQPAVSLDQTIQWKTNIAVGYGAFVIGDEKGDPLPSGPGASDPYVYVFYADRDTAAPGLCQFTICAALARARFSDLAAAAHAPGEMRGPRLFKKYYRGAFGEPAVAAVQSSSAAAGHYTPIFPDESAAQILPTAIYDSVLRGYLLAYFVPKMNSIHLRWARNVLRWSEVIGMVDAPPGHFLFYPSLLGEDGHPLIGGKAPLLFYIDFAKPPFTNWANESLMVRRLELRGEPSPAAREHAAGPAAGPGR